MANKPFLSPAAIRNLRPLVQVPHFYDRSSRALEIVDGEEQWAAAVVTTNHPCRYKPAKRGQIGADGALVMDVPQLVVLHDDPIEAGDLVSNIRNTMGAVLMDGPAQVLAVSASDYGDTLQKRALLASVRRPT